VPSLPVAEEGYRGWQRNQRVVVTGTRNKLLAQAAQLLPRRVVLRMVRELQSPR
jgi:short-subunit dehydrogenase